MSGQELSSTGPSERGRHMGDQRKAGEDFVPLPFDGPLGVNSYRCVFKKALCLAASCGERDACLTHGTM